MTYVLHDAASLPPETVDHRPKAAGVVVEETLRVDVQGARDVDVERPPDRAEDIQRGVGAVFRQRVVVLDFFSHIGQQEIFCLNFFSQKYSKKSGHSR